MNIFIIFVILRQHWLIGPKLQYKPYGVQLVGLLVVCCSRWSFAVLDGCYSVVVEGPKGWVEVGGSIFEADCSYRSEFRTCVSC